MTWSVSHSISYTSAADNHAAMVYLFDTVFANSTGWTVQAHPDSSAVKRRLRFTALNRLTGTNYTMYHWVNWQSTSPTYVTWNEDATYTTTPGDTATDTTTGFNSQMSWTTTGEGWKFCTSTDNSESILVLKGGKVAFYWPGITEGVFFPDPAWSPGSTDNRGTWVSPHIGYSHGSLQNANAPIETNTGAFAVMLPDAGWAPSASSSGFRIGGNYIATNFNWLYGGQTSSFYGDERTAFAFRNGGHTDVGVFQPSSITNAGDCRRPFAYTANGITMQIGSNYWLNPWTDLGRQGVVFNFGAVDPLA